MRPFSQIAAVSVALLATVSASPVAQSDAKLERRDDFPNQILYAVNCFDLGCLNTRECIPSVSFLAWYKDWQHSQQNEQPDSLSREYKDWSDPRNNHNNGNGFPLRWEGVDYHLHFDDSNSDVEIKIESWGQDVGKGTDVGFASNSFGTRFACKKDDNRDIFERWTGSNAYHCQSIYYCPKA